MNFQDTFNILKEAICHLYWLLRATRQNICYSGVNCVLGLSKSIRYSGVCFHIFYCNSAGLSDVFCYKRVFAMAEFRLRVVPHFSSGIVERVKRKHAWKSPHARKGYTRWGERRMRVSHFSLSLPHVTFSRIGWFSCVLTFRSLYYPWGKMGDYS